VAFDVLPLAGERTGVGRFCAGLASAFAGRDELELRGYAVARSARGDPTAAAAALGIDVRAWPIPARLANAAWSRAEFPPIEWLVGATDVVHGTNFVVPPSRRAGRVVTVHDLAALRYPELCMPASLTYPALVLRATRRGAFVHVPSHFVRQEVLELLGVEGDRIRVIPHGIDHPGPGSVAPPSPVGGSARTAPYVLALGAVEPRKDLPTLVSAFAQLAGAYADLELVVAGPSGWGEPAFAAAVAASGLGRRVVRVGYLGDRERESLLRGAAVFAFPSLYEGFGFPPLEAMAVGVPVVATAAGAVPEVVGDAAELVPAGDVEALAGALARVVDDGPVRDRLVAAGRDRAATFTWAAAADSLIELYRLAASDRRSR
jgi:glycosyltransferase involved in cell wall biosynthesis